MGNDHKKRVEAALQRYYEKENKKSSPAEPRQHYGKPEKEVEKACLEWMRAQGWSVNIFEAKATFDPNRQVWRNQSMKAGTCDCMGNLPDGIGVAIEFKAPGRLSTFNSDKRFLQRKFIVDKINSNTFACVVDSVERLQVIYQKWRELREKNTDFAVARNYLIQMLPQQKDKTRLDDEPLFDE